MAGTSDALIEHLLHKLATVGEKGLTAVRFVASVREFYEQQNAKITDEVEPSSDIDLLFSEAPPNQKTVVDDDLIDMTYEWLLRRSDVHLKPQVEVEQGNGHDASMTPQASESATLAQVASSYPTPARLDGNLAGQVICASEERVWLELTGHGVDHIRVPAKEFECLLAIAASGPGGILQKYVVQQTGQDKRSVPKRTDRLAESGYIVKESVIAERSKTSALTLSKFKKVQKQVEPGPVVPTNLLSNNSVVYYDEWFNTILHALKENGNIVSFDYLYGLLGISKEQWQRKRFFKCMRRMTQSGLVHGVTAKYNVPVTTGTDVIKEVVKPRKLRCIELRREPTDHDRLVFKASDAPSSRPVRLTEAQDVLEEEQENDEYMSTLSQHPEEQIDPDLRYNLPFTAPVIGLRASGANTHSTPCSWTPNMSMYQQIFRMVDESGSKGMTSRELCSQLTGPHYTRPVDEMLAKLTDVWQFSQPHHLRHLTIVRDTIMSGKSTVFQYHTLPNFEALVAAGETSWEAIEHMSKVQSTANGRSFAPILELDEWGFVKPPKKAFAQGGRATLAECRKGIKAPRLSAVAHDPSNHGRKEKKRTRTRTSTATTDPKSQPPPKNAAPQTKATSVPKQPPPKHSVTQVDIDTYAATAQRMAKVKVMCDLLRARKTAQSAENPTASSGPLNIADLPDDLVNQAQADIIAHEKPGVYINPPRARSLKWNHFIATGRPRKSLIAVFKFTWLKDLEWFAEDGGPVVVGKGIRPRTSLIGRFSRFEPRIDSAGFGDEGKTRERDASLSGPERKRRRVENSGAPTMRVTPGSTLDTAAESILEMNGHPVLQVSGITLYDTKSSRRLKLLVEKKPRGRPPNAYLHEIKSLQREVRRELRDGPPPRLVVKLKMPDTVATVLEWWRFPQDATNDDAGVLADTTTDDSMRERTVNGMDEAASGLPNELTRVVDRHESSAIVEPTESLEQTAGDLSGRLLDSVEQEVNDLPKDHPGEVEQADVVPPTSLTSGAEQPLADLPQHSTEGVTQPATHLSGRHLNNVEHVANTLHEDASNSLQQIAYRLPESHTKRCEHELPSNTAGSPQQTVSTTEPNALIAIESTANEVDLSSGPAVTHESMLVAPHVNTKITTTSDSVDGRIETVPNVLANQTKGGLDVYLADSANPATLESDAIAGTTPISSTQAADTNSSDADMKPYEEAYTQLYQLKHLRGRKSRATLEEVARLEEFLRQAPQFIDIARIQRDTHVRAQQSIQRSATQTSNLEHQDTREAGDTRRSLRIRKPKVIDHDSVGALLGDQTDQDPVETELPLDSENPVDTVEESLPVIAADDRNSFRQVPRNHNKVSHKQTDSDSQDPDYQDDSPSTPLDVKSTSLALKQAHMNGHKVGVRYGGGTVALFRNKVVLAPVHACGGVFPGNNEMWYVVATAWQKRYGQHPDRNTIRSNLRNLIASGKLKKVTWTFADKRGLVQTRSIITEPHITPDSNQVKALQKIIQVMLPNQFLPPEVEITPHLRHQAINTYNVRNLASLNLVPDAISSSNRLRFPVDPELTVQESLGLTAQNMGSEDAVALRIYREDIGNLEFQFVKPSQDAENLEDRDDGSVSSEEDPLALDMDFAGVIDPAQAAMQSTIQLGNYRHDFHSALPPRINPQSRIASRLRFDRPQARLPAPIHRFPGYYFHHALPIIPAKRALPKWSRKSAGLALRECEDQWVQAQKLLMGPTQLFHWPTGTFATRGWVLKPSRRELADWTTRSNIYKHGRPVLDLRDALDKAAKMNDFPVVEPEDKCEALYQEIDNLQAWEETIVQSGRGLPQGIGLTLINHTLKHPHTIPSTRPLSSVFTTVPDWAIIVETGLSSETRIYQTRKSKTDEDGRPFQRDKKSVAAFKHGESLLAAVALITTVCGGINQDRLNWSLVAHAMSFRHDGEWLRRRWQLMARTRTLEMVQLRNIIRKPFLVAYKTGELPHLDFQNLAKTDWPAILRWVETKIVPLLANNSHMGDPKSDALGSRVPELPSIKVEFDEQFTLEYRQPICEATRDSYHTTITTEVRSSMLQRFVNGTLLPGEVRPSEIMNEHFILLRSWIRAVALTKQRNYIIPVAGAKLGVFPEEILKEATQKMVDERIILQDKKGRHFPGRNFQIHSDVLHQFRRWPKQDEHMFLRLVANARDTINDHFRVSDSLTLIPTAQDAEYLVLTNMVAQGFIRPDPMIPERNDDVDAPSPRLTAWSYGNGSYETRQIDIRDIQYPIVYEKTERYKYEHGLRFTPIPTGPALVDKEPGRRIPIWIDIHDNLIDDVWDMVLRSILHLLVYRPGSSAKAMEAAHHEKLWSWEIDLILQWMEQVGLAEHSGHGNRDGARGFWRGGWRASEWWYCAFVPEIATWSTLRVNDTHI